MNLTDATVEDMVTELERRGLHAAVVTAPRTAPRIGGRHFLLGARILEWATDRAADKFTKAA
jgi:hypothetical protein